MQDLAGFWREVRCRCERFGCGGALCVKIGFGGVAAV